MSNRLPGEYKYIRRRKAIKKWLIVFGVVVVLAACTVGVIIIIKKASALHSSEKYIASDEAGAVVYIYDEYEKRLFRTSDVIQRGSIVTVTGEEYSENGRTYAVIEYGGETYYAEKSALVDSLDDIVQETEKWIRTSVTVYSNSEDSQIESFIKKGSCVEIIGYDYLNDDGSVNMYQIQSDDITGWVYAKYLVGTQEEAEAIY